MSTSTEISLGYSPCPNDTFVFCALAEGRIDTGDVAIRTVIEDVETLNKRAQGAELDVTKISFHAYAYLRDRYQLLRSGAALGRGCGPVVVAREPMDSETLAGKDEPEGPMIAIPGELTTATLLLRLFAPGVCRFLICPFDQIFDKILEGKADAGVIIHESRFTYESRGLVKVVDLGEWWESETDLPIPLGGIMALKSLGDKRIEAIDRWIRKSVVDARKHPERTGAYVHAHAQEMDEEVVQAHINLYVNDFTVNLGDEGQQAVDMLMEMAGDRGILGGSS